MLGLGLLEERQGPEVLVRTLLPCFLICHPTSRSSRSEPSKDRTDSCTNHFFFCRSVVSTMKVLSEPEGIDFYTFRPPDLVDFVLLQ